jgi:hypothetical protein
MTVGSGGAFAKLPQAGLFRSATARCPWISPWGVVTRIKVKIGNDRDKRTRNLWERSDRDPRSVQPSHPIASARLCQFYTRFGSFAKCSQLRGEYAKWETCSPGQVHLGLCARLVEATRVIRSRLHLLADQGNDVLLGEASPWHLHHRSGDVLTWVDHQAQPIPSC